MKLTRRQEEFVSNLLELSHKFDGPIHYSVVAERLGVSPFTAYDMLCLLEEKGWVRSEYQLATDKSGPGRAERLFFPTKTALAQRQQLSEEAGDEINEFLFEQMRKGELKEQDILDEMLARIPPVENRPIRYCVEVMTIIALRLRQCPGRLILQEYLPEILTGTTPANRTSLSLLGGFAFGILSTECASDQEWLGVLFMHVGQYLDIVSKMSPAEYRQLGEYLEKVFTPSAETMQGVLSA
jgi:hypothetical protein